MEGIANEHTKMAGCDIEFTTSNYLFTTTPHKEYDIATGKQECPEKDMMDRKKLKVRRIQRIDELKPEALEICKRAGLVDYEILAVVSFELCACTVTAQTILNCMGSRPRFQ